ncbi:hypothetical protein LCGC14_2492390 [marine sediment metagenome]|uniref:Uncharacterized protein n=1 Tax=marine sediment metagenome TaxID=412755 RepID=A0A0F9B548_9ZZZZ
MDRNKIVEDGYVVLISHYINLGAHIHKARLRGEQYVYLRRVGRYSNPNEKRWQGRLLPYAGRVE